MKHVLQFDKDFSVVLEGFRPYDVRANADNIMVMVPNEDTFDIWETELRDEDEIKDRLATYYEKIDETWVGEPIIFDRRSKGREYENYAKLGFTTIVMSRNWQKLQEIYDSEYPMWDITFLGYVPVDFNWDTLSVEGTADNVRYVVESSFKGDRIREVGAQIGEYYLQKNNGDYESAGREVANLRVTDLSFIGVNRLAIKCCRPGLLIGRRGHNIDMLSQHIGMSVKVVEDSMDFTYIVTPVDYDVLSGESEG